MTKILPFAELEALIKTDPIIAAIVQDRILAIDEFHRRYKMWQYSQGGFIITPIDPKANI